MTNVKAVIGIDPGKKGALALINGLDNIEIYDFPNSFSLFYQIIKKWDEQFNIKAVVLEKVGPLAVQGKKAAFTFGQNAGVLEGVLIGMELSYQLVPPKEWQKVVNKRDGRTPKERASNTVRKLFPHLNIPETKDGRADALLMAYYGWTRLLNE